MSANGQEAVVASPLAIGGVALAAFGFWRGSAVAVLAGGLAIGLGLRLHPFSRPA